MRKRSAYRPRTVITDPLSLLRPASQPAKDAVMLRFWSALEAMARGTHPGEAEWRDLSDAINTVETLAVTLKKVNAQQVMPLVNAAIKGMVSASVRYRTSLGMRLSGEDLQALRAVVAIYEQCLDTLTEREMAVAQAETQRRIHALLHSRRSSAEVIAL